MSEINNSVAISESGTEGINPLALAVLQAEGIIIPEKGLNIPKAIKDTFKERTLARTGVKATNKEVTVYFQSIQKKLRGGTDQMIAEANRLGWEQVTEKVQIFADQTRKLTVSWREPAKEKSSSKLSGFEQLVSAALTSMCTFNEEGVRIPTKAFWTYCKAVPALAKDNVAADLVSKFQMQDAIKQTTVNLKKGSINVDAEVMQDEVREMPSVDGNGDEIDQSFGDSVQAD